MHGGNDNGGGNKWVPSDRYERYSGPNKEIREQYKKAMWERESSKPSTQLDSSSAASSSKGKNK